jgi:hypothetical protein
MIYMALYVTSGFWPRVRAHALRAPVILSHATPKGRCAHPAYRSFAAFIYPPKLSLDPNSAARGVYLSIGLSCTLLSYIAR